MSKSQGRTEEKTAKQIISDEELIRLLRIDLKSGIYPTQQATAAVLRSLDAANAELAGIHRFAVEVAAKQAAEIITSEELNETSQF
jgi:hypothetical protein